MAWSFGDGFDLYAASLDAINGFWDSSPGGNLTVGLAVGRFTGSRALGWGSNSLSPSLLKSSGVNDAVHHVVVAYNQTAAITGSSTGIFIHLRDGATAQCSIVFRSDGAILLTSGIHTGTTLATYTGAVTANNTWYAFEFEVVINNTTGAFRVRKNGNTINDFDSGATLNTRGGTANNYVNAIGPGQSNTAGGAGNIDDLFWRSDASSVPWMGDIRCYTRMPASDVGTPQFSRTPTTNTVPLTAGSFTSITSGVARYTPFIATYDGTIGAAIASFNSGYTGNLKATIFASSGSAPTTILGSATVVVNPIGGNNTLTFGTPVAVARGVQYWLGLCSDATGQININPSGTSGLASNTSYASFPTASPGGSNQSAPAGSVTITLTTNYGLVAELQQDTTTSYVYDSTPGDQDFYGIAAITSTPVATVAVTTRGYMQKSDAGTRTAAVQLKSGSATVASPTLVLTTSGWQWAWRMDTTDPNTSAAWTPAAVNNAQVGPKVIA